MMPWLVLTLGLITTAGISEQTRRFGSQEHQRIESTLLGKLIEALRSKLQIDIKMLAVVVSLFNAPTPDQGQRPGASQLTLRGQA